MPISGLVVTLLDEPFAREASLAAMREHPFLDIGEIAEGRVPVVVDTLDENEDRLVWEWLHSLPGVALVVVAFISFDDDSQSLTPSLISDSVLQEVSPLSIDREP